MKYVYALIGSCLFAACGFAETPPAANLSLTDQFDAVRDLKDFRGDVTILVYGDRKATDANKALGERLFVAWHPSAKGKSPADARKAPVAPLAGAARSPDVHVVPVACTGKVPEVIMTFVKRELKKASPDVPVWLDTESKMKDTFGLRDGEPNIVVIDPAGRLRYRVLGEPDAKTEARLTEIVDFLRKEAAGK